MTFYLAISNLASPDTVVRVREKLISKGYKTLEWGGKGKYTTDALMMSDAVVFIPEEKSNVFGKGLYTEHKVFTEKYPERKCYFYTDCNFYEITGTVPLKQNDWRNYALVKIDPKPSEI